MRGYRKKKYFQYKEAGSSSQLCEANPFHFYSRPHEKYKITVDSAFRDMDTSSVKLDQNNSEHLKRKESIKIDHQLKLSNQQVILSISQEQSKNNSVESIIQLKNPTLKKSKEERQSQQHEERHISQDEDESQGQEYGQSQESNSEEYSVSGNVQHEYESKEKQQTKKQLKQEEKVAYKPKNIVKSVKKNEEDLEQCSICSHEFQKGNLIIFSYQCRHSLCDDCLLEYMLNQIQAFKLVTCPFQGCSQSLDESSLLLQMLPQQTQQRYYNILIFEYANKSNTIKICPDQNCQGYIMTNQKPVVCVVCNQQYCPKCIMKKHKGNCDQNGAQILQKHFNFMQCKKCSLMVDKIKGCDHMTCRCEYQFCYRCGKKWQLQHQCVKKGTNQEVQPPPPPAVQAVLQRRQNRAPEVQAREAPRAARVDNSCCLNYVCYFLFGIFLIDIAVTLFIIIYFALAFIAIMFKGITYRAAILYCEYIFRYNCFDNRSCLQYIPFILTLLLILPMIVGIIHQIMQTLIPHYQTVVEKKLLCPIANSID